MLTDLYDGISCPLSTTKDPRGVAKENADKTHCVNGHPLEGDNLIIQYKPDGGVHRGCKECRRKWSRKPKGDRLSRSVSPPLFGCI